MSTKAAAVPRCCSFSALHDPIEFLKLPDCGSPTWTTPFSMDSFSPEFSLIVTRMGSGGGKYVFPTLSIFTSLISSDFFSRASSSCCCCWESFECFLLLLLLLRFNRSHVHKNRSVITITTATAMPIIPHSFKPKTFVFLESSLDRLLFPIETQETRAAPFFLHCLP